MKRLIFLKLPDPDPTNLLQGEALHKAELKSFNSTIKNFREAVKEISSIKIIQEISLLPQIIIEFPDNQKEEAYQFLLYNELVELIDCQLPLSDKELKAKEKAQLKAEEIAAKRAKPIPKSKNKKKKKKSEEDE